MWTDAPSKIPAVFAGNKHATHFCHYAQVFGFQDRLQWTGAAAAVYSVHHRDVQVSGLVLTLMPPLVANIAPV